MFAGDALPGMFVETAPEPARSPLPRMDVAVFAGFTARGPCHRPVAVASVAQFEAVFGGDLALAWDAGRDMRLAANLPAAVRAFFANGGRRCWVIRVASTAALVEAWGEAAGLPPAAVAGRFAMPGILAVAGSGAPAPAELVAASLGAWSDSLRLAARVSRHPFALAEAVALPGGFSCRDGGVVAPGELIEVRGGGDGRTTAYAKALHAEAGRLFALWIAAFRRREQGGTLAGQPGLRVGSWAEAGGGAWLGVERTDGDSASGPVWDKAARQLPAAPLAAARLTLDLREYFGASARTHAGLSPSPEGAAALQSIADADLFYADPANRTAALRPAFAVTLEEARAIDDGYRAAGDPRGFAGLAGRFGRETLSEAELSALRSAWLPIGLEETFADPAAPIGSGVDPLVRDGLGRPDERLFLDPRLIQGDAAAVAERAAAILHVEESPLFGIHAAFDIPGDLFPEASLLAVPDAAQPDWAESAVKAPPSPEPGSPAQANWTNHAGGCAAEPVPAKLKEPDRSRFLDCSTRLLPAPQLTAPATVAPDTPFRLEWSGLPAGGIAVVEESGLADFGAAAEIHRGAGARFDIAAKPEGLYYYRVRFEQDDNVSAYAAAAVVVRGSRFEAGEVDRARLRRLQLAMLRLAGGSGDLFALLSLPQGFRTADALDHAAALRRTAAGAGDAGRLGSHEQRLLSFGALYHPWLVAGSGAGLAAAAPDGAVAGLFAARARERGAWIAPANEDIAGTVGLDPSLPEPELLALDRGRVNMIRRLPRGFGLHDADTLSNEPDWRQVNVRRLMMLLRRTALRRGMTFVFEPNGATLRRALERELGAMLDDFQVRGAFAGRNSAESFRIAVHDRDRDEARLTVEIGVAPAQPMRFLTLRLERRGGALTAVEEG